MSVTKLIFLRHADTEKNASVNAAEWNLSEKGRQQAVEVSKLLIMDSVDVIYVSEERKTSLTVAPLAARLNKAITPLAFFNEVKRGDAFLTKEEFEAEKVRQLQDLSFPAFDGESGNEALIRFKLGIEQITKENEGRTILIVTHGTVLNIYFADLLNAYADLSQRWNKTTFCAVGIVEDGKVVQDIVTSIQ